jgi:hypothetical protein
LSNSSASKGAYDYTAVNKRSTDIEVFTHNNTWQVYKNNVLVDANF